MSRGALSLLALAAAGSLAWAQCAPPVLTVTGSYTINGVFRPVLNLGEGQAYTFNASAVPSFHPLILTTSATGGGFNGEMSAAMLPGYVAGGVCGGCPQSSFTITPSASTPASFFYQCHIHSGLGAAINVSRKPQIDMQPAESMTVCPNTFVMIHAMASIPGAGAGVQPTYQWRKNGQAIAGETGYMLHIDSAGSGDTGSYDCVVTNGCASVTTTSTQLTVRPACCVADVDDGSGAGMPDGGVTIEDLLFYLVVFGLGSPRADVDNGGGTGTPDGGVTIEDLLYYLQRFEAGC